MSDKYEGQIDLDTLIGDIKPNMVTPQLDKLTSAQNNRKTKVLAEIMMTAMVNGLHDPVKKEIVHNGDVHLIKYVNVEPLFNGPWAGLSLMLLNLSYGEQSTIIESTYPERLQFHAKAFAAVFTPELRQTTVTVRQDAEVIQLLKEANAGIAMLLARGSGSEFIPHADEILLKQSDMADLVNESEKRKAYKKSYEKSQDVAKSMNR